jgi:hypothetical protein
MQVRGLDMLIANSLCKWEDWICSLQIPYGIERSGYVHCKVLMEMKGTVIFIAKYLRKWEDRLCSLQIPYGIEKNGYIHCNVLMVGRGADMFIANSLRKWEEWICSLQTSLYYKEARSSAFCTPLPEGCFVDVFVVEVFILSRPTSCRFSWRTWRPCMENLSQYLLSAFYLAAAATTLQALKP